MKHLKFTLGIAMLLMVSTKAFTQDVAELTSNSTAHQGYFAYMAKPEWLVIGSDAADVEVEVHLPRIHSVTELTWSHDNRYLTFTAKDRQHWLYDLQTNVIRLLESLPVSHAKVKFSPQWSGDSQWLLFVSHKANESRPRIYSVEKKHSYALPISANEFSTIAWAGESNAIKVLDFIGEAQRLTSFEAFDITLVKSNDNGLTALNK
jgi:WD40 repeat protein